jgi:hypothetical protein
VIFIPASLPDNKSNNPPRFHWPLFVPPFVSREGIPPCLILAKVPFFGKKMAVPGAFHQKLKSGHGKTFARIIRSAKIITKNGIYSANILDDYMKEHYTVIDGPY